MKGFPFVPMEVVERSLYDGGTYFLIQTVSERDGYEVAEVRPDIPWQLQTAQFLSAAPELLEALELAVSLYGKDGGPWNVPQEPGSWISKARAAIAKARGTP